MSERRISAELAAQIAAHADQRRAMLAWAARVLEAHAVAKRVVAVLTEGSLALRELRARAVLTVRCQDCDGRGEVGGLAIAHVTYVLDGRACRPMLCTRQGRGSWSQSLLDDGFWGDVANCRVREYVLPAAVLMAQLPRRRAGKSVEVRVSH